MEVDKAGQRSQSGDSGLADAVRGMGWADGEVPTPPEREPPPVSPKPDGRPDLSDLDPFSATAARQDEDHEASFLPAPLSSISSGRPPSPPPTESKPSQPTLSPSQAVVPPGAVEPTAVEPARRSSVSGAAWTQLFGGLRNSVGRGRSESSGAQGTSTPPLPPVIDEKEALREKASTPTRPSDPEASPTSTSPFASTLSHFASALKRPLVTPSPPPHASGSGSGSSTPRPTPSRSQTPRGGSSRLTLLPPTPLGNAQKGSPSSPWEKEPLTPSRATDHDPTPSVPGVSPQSGSSTRRGEAEAEASLPFDFNRFLEQMRARGAEPVGKYLRSFLKEFQKRTMWTVGDQVRVINDFLDFISVKMREIPDGPWHSSACSEAEFDNAVEAMEKLVMNRLWHLTYTPALPSYLLPSATDDIERDTVLSQKMKLFAWVDESNLDLDLSGQHAGGGDEDEVEREKVGKRERDPGVEGFLEFAKTELLKINAYKAPRDKMICVLNCCKVIFGLIRHLDSNEGADTFIPILILVVLKASPEHTISNLQYIQRFRNPDKLQGESGYYLSSLNAAVSFIEKMDHSALSNITQAEFEHNVEEAILTLPRSVDQTPELTQLSTFQPSPRTPNNPPPTLSARRSATPSPVPSRPRSPLPPLRRTPQPSPSAHAPAAAEAESAADIQPNVSFPDATKAWFQRMPDLAERAVSKPLNAIARIVDDLAGVPPDEADTRSARTGPPPGYFPPYHPQYMPPPPPAGVPPLPSLGRKTSNTSLSSAGSSAQPPGSVAPSPSRPPRSRHPSSQPPSASTPLTDPAHRGAYVADTVDPSTLQAELDRRDRLSREVHAANLETLKSIFPNLEREVLEVVLVTNEEQMGKTIDALLEMSAGGEPAGGEHA